jgi:hypothetical protein
MDEIPSRNLWSCMAIRLVGVSRMLNALPLCFLCICGQRSIRDRRTPRSMGVSGPLTFPRPGNREIGNLDDESSGFSMVKTPK